MYKNKIQFNCQCFIEITPTVPQNCYNCMGRDGHPRNLGGDKKCANFKMYERRKPDSIKILKREVWDLFSEWKRRSEADENGYCRCVTCGAIRKWTDGDAGHWKHGTSFFIPEIVHFQCKICNGYGAGMAVEYTKWMTEHYTPNEIAKFLNQVKYLNKKLSSFELLYYKKMYQAKLKELQ